MPILTRDIEIALRGVRAQFALVIDQAAKQLAAVQTDVYLDAQTKAGPLFEEIPATGQQRVEAVSFTGVSRLLPTEEGEEFKETSYVPSFVTSVEPFKFTRRVKVSRESADRQDAKYQKALNWVSKLNIAVENTKAQHKFDRFNKAFALVTDEHLFDYGDGVPLCSTSHPDKIGGVHSNVVTASDITPSSVESMVLVLQNQTDDIGEPMPMGGGAKYIVVPRAKVRRAKEVLESEWVVDTANNNINVWRGQGWIMVTSPYLTSNTAWFILDANESPLKVVNFRPVTNETWFDNNTKMFVHDISFEHKVGAFDYRGLVGNQGA
jgi:hypothetical protein